MCALCLSGILIIVNFCLESDLGITKSIKFTQICATAKCHQMKNCYAVLVKSSGGGMSVYLEMTEIKT